MAVAVSSECLRGLMNPSGGARKPLTGLSCFLYARAYAARFGHHRSRRSARAVSIRVMTSVWAHSTQKGSALLVLLAIADNANDQGGAWPSAETLAEKTRMSKRQVLRLVHEIAKTGELSITPWRDGRSTHNFYRVLVTEGSQGQLVTVKPTPTVTNPVVHGDIAMSPEPLEPITNPTGWRANGNETSAQELVAHFVDESKAKGGEPPRRVIGQIAKLTGEMLAEGITPARVRAGIDRLVERGLHPSVLPAAVHEAGLSRARDAPRVTGWRFVRGSHGSTYVPDPEGTDTPPREYR